MKSKSFIGKFIFILLAMIFVSNAELSAAETQDVFSAEFAENVEEVVALIYKSDFDADVYIGENDIVCSNECKVTIEHNVNTNQIGKNEVRYIVKDVISNTEIILVRNFYVTNPTPTFISNSGEAITPLGSSNTNFNFTINGQGYSSKEDSDAKADAGASLFINTSSNGINLSFRGLCDDAFSTSFGQNDFECSTTGDVYSIAIITEVRFNLIAYSSSLDKVVTGESYEHISTNVYEIGKNALILRLKLNM